MLFNSLAFLLFFPLVTMSYFIVPSRFRWVLLLAASCYFYSYFIPVYLLILIFTIVIDYFAGIMIENANDNHRKIFLITSIAANISVLAFFKYFNFISMNMTQTARAFHYAWTGPLLRFALPIGLSFHTFQAMSYTIEVYRRHQKAEHHFGIYALYVMFYPQLVAGPIERPQNLLPQLHRPYQFDYADLRGGLQLMLIGFLKKIIVADRAAIFVNRVYDNPHIHTAPALLLATFFFAIQIYADFSGYSDIAVGAARVMGIRLMTNFKQPYFSKSVAEFWSRWHISLSTWFRDYLYIPLGGSRTSCGRWQFNLFFTFMISGFWHGANWTFIVWGALNGLFLVLSNITKHSRTWVHARLKTDAWPRLLAVWQTLVTFLLTCAAWVFFRSQSIADARHVFTTVAGHLDDLFCLAAIRTSLMPTGFDFRDLAALFAITTGLLVIDGFAYSGTGDEHLRRQPRWVRWGLYYAAILLIIRLGNFGPQQFIYFQF